MNMRGPKELSCGGILRSCPYTGAEKAQSSGVLSVSGRRSPSSSLCKRGSVSLLGGCSTPIRQTITISSPPPCATDRVDWLSTSRFNVTMFQLSGGAVKFTLTHSSCSLNSLSIYLRGFSTSISYVVLSYCFASSARIVSSSKFAWLRSENHQILDKLNKASDSNDLVLQENVILKEENLELRQVITSMKKLGGAEGGSTSFHERYCSSSLDHDLDQDFSCITNDPKTHHPS
ncbi:unnamed protein product [Brassica napus]|uniref:(rape) hypothetical protein n=1 Tax=Brassica napus TaxID=3708 RepID=A0A816HWC6_BRANA|nr:unnamed protein product [Brassica napus]